MFNAGCSMFEFFSDFLVTPPPDIGDNASGGWFHVQSSLIAHLMADQCRYEQRVDTGNGPVG